jgi:hypothetical protein
MNSLTNQNVLNFSFDSISQNMLSSSVVLGENLKSTETASNCPNQSLQTRPNDQLNISSSVIQDVVKENAFNFILSYLENQTKLNNGMLKVSPKKVSTSKNSTKKRYDGSKQSPLMSLQECDAAFNSPTCIKPKNDLKLLGFNASIHSIQNWCAKCNSSFRLTSDLVYHMRTFHRKEENNTEAKIISNLNENALNLIKSNNARFLQESQKSSRESNCLRCEICNEVFKEKHHMR